MHFVIKDSARARVNLIISACIVVFTFLLFLPLILHPHWGMFDDAALILQPGRRFIDDPSSLSDALGAGLRSGIFVWVIFLWRLFPNNAAAFYAINWVIFTSAVLLLYAISLRLTGSARVSSISTSAVFLASGLFEVIYALDKQEVYLPILFSATVLSHVIGSDVRSRRFPFFCAVSACCAAAAYVSKETGMVLCVFSGCLCLLLSVRYLLIKDHENWIGAARGSLLFLSVLIPFLILRLIFPAGTFQSYVTLNFALPELILKISRYITVMPEFPLYVVICVYAWIRSCVTLKPLLTQQWCIFSALLFSSLAGAVALICFNTSGGVLLYIWLPIYFLLLPCLAVALSSLTLPNSKFGKTQTAILLVSMILICCIQAPRLFVRAQFQFAMDSLAAELSTKMASLVGESSVPILGAVPLFSIGTFELGENLECFVRSKLASNYYSSSNEKTSDYKFAMLNFLTCNQADIAESTDPPGWFRLNDFRGTRDAYTSDCPKDYVGWSGFQLLVANATPHWIRRKFTTGDWLIVPYGNVSSIIVHRGAQIFELSLEDSLVRFPQMTFKEIGNVSCAIFDLLGKRQHLGWKILKVLSAKPIVAETDIQSSLASGTKIDYQFEPDNPILTIVSQHRTIAPIIYVRDSDGHTVTVVPVEKGGKTLIQIPLKNAISSHPFVQLTWALNFPNLKYDSLTMERSLDRPDTLELKKEVDGWLVNNSAIVYPTRLQGQKLSIITDCPHANHIKLIGAETTQIESDVSSKSLQVSLNGGFKTADGRSYLVLDSPTPMKIPGDPRSLLTHVVQFSVTKN